MHWFCWHPTPYNDHLFQHLAKDRSIDLIVHYRSRTLASHPWQSALAQGYSARFYAVLFGLDWHVISLALNDRGAFFVIAGWDHLTSQILLTLLRLFRRSYALFTDTPAVDGSRSKLVARARGAWLRWVFAGAVRVMSTGIIGMRNLKRMGASEHQLTNFPYWIDLVSYARRYPPNCRPAKPLRIVSSGRIVNRLKGHDIAIRALAQAADRIAVPFEYFIAGTGPDENELREVVARLGLNDKVRWLGWLEPDDVRKLYEESDLLLHPSPVHEPYGVAVIEAMAMQLVVLASDVTYAATDRIEHGINGFIHRAGNVDELAEQICFLLQNPDLMPQIGRRARDTAELWPVRRGVNIIREMVQSASCKA